MEKIKLTDTTIWTPCGSENRAIRRWVINKETGKEELKIVGYEDSQAMLQELAESVSLANVMTVDPLTGEAIIKRRIEGLEYMDTRNIPRDIIEYTKLTNNLNKMEETKKAKINEFNKEMQLKEKLKKEENKGETK